MTERDTTAGLFPALLKHWRGKSGLSQLDLAVAADVSSRHISFLETGRSVPSAEMVLRLAATLGVPLRHTNAMLRAADHPPAFAETDPGEGLPEAVQSAIDLMKEHHEPFPLIVVDRSYRVLDLNRSAASLLASLLRDPDQLSGDDLNLARFMFDPDGGHAIIENFAEIGREILWRLQREVLTEPDHGPLRELLDEILAMETVDPAWRETDLTAPSAPTVEARLRVGDEIWSFVLLITAIQAPLTVALDELRIELWFPADEQTAAGCRALAAPDT